MGKEKLYLPASRFKTCLVISRSTKLFENKFFGVISNECEKF
jgi:hypothetical protein